MYQILGIYPFILMMSACIIFPRLETGTIPNTDLMAKEGIWVFLIVLLAWVPFMPFLLLYYSLVRPVHRASIKWATNRQNKRLL